MYALDDTGQRRVRRVTQSLPMPELYATLAEALGKELGLTLVAQRPEALLGLTDDLDINADLSPKEFLQRIKQHSDRSSPDQTDWYTPINTPLAEGMPPERWMATILDGRNVSLAAKVHKSDYPKIVITYGAAHEPGWMEEMRKLDPSWRPV